MFLIIILRFPFIKYFHFMLFDEEMSEIKGGKMVKLNMYVYVYL
jgi:ABC-type Mn2+/Zn2+ transport system permease subunit